MLKINELLHKSAFQKGIDTILMTYWCCRKYHPNENQWTDFILSIAICIFIL